MKLIFASAAAQAKATREKKISAGELVEDHVRRIKEVNPRLNAVAQLAAESARTQAQGVDQALARGEIKAPLHGVPFTLKDAIETVGTICTAGTQGRPSYLPAEDATFVPSR